MKLGVCIVAYNRLNSFKRVLESVSNAYYNDDNVTLIISIDKSDNTKISEYADSFQWKYGEKRVIKHPVNLGLRKHILQCGDLLDEFDALVILEDDVTVAPSYYYYVRQCIEKFHDNPSIAGISLYSFPFNYNNYLPFYPLYSDSDVFLIQSAQSWGEVWMKESWKAFKRWYRNNNEEFTLLPQLQKSICNWPKSSWLKYHIRYCIEAKKYFVYPYVSLSTNNSDPGVHCKEKNTVTQSMMLFGRKEKFNLNPKIKYDGFLENELIYLFLGVESNDLCVDFYGEKGNREKKKYWLTMSAQPYKIIRKYGLLQKPYEWNIINNIDGNDIFLYDTTIRSNKPQKTLYNQFELFKYLYGFLDFKDILRKFKKFFIIFR